MPSRNRTFAALACGSAALLCFVVGHRSAPIARAASADAPAYAANGEMLPLSNYREWIYLTSGIDMSYAPKASAMDHSMFDNVFVNPAAYKSFLATGTWPDKTVMVLEVREARSKGSINQRGHFQGTDLMGFEVHVKDKARFPGEWAFFDFDSPDKNGTLIPQGAPCYTCHAAHGAVDTTFVQFYPTLLPLAQKKGTLSDAFLKEEAATAHDQPATAPRP
ncbi:MAG: cytochrome P460 family protein [Terracidiphilus sp.]